MNFHMRLLLVICPLALLAPAGVVAQSTELGQALRSLLASQSGENADPKHASEIPERFRGDWYSRDALQCEIMPLSVSAEGVFDYGGFVFKQGRLDGDRLTWSAPRCEEGECESSSEEVTLELRDGRLSFSYLTDESGDHLWLKRCPDSGRDS